MIKPKFPLILIFAIYLGLEYINPQIAEEFISKSTKFQMDETGMIIVNRTIKDRNTNIDFEDSSHSLILGKIKEYNSDNQLIREVNSFSFIQVKKEEEILLGRNSTKLTFTLTKNSSANDLLYYNPKATLQIFIYLIKRSQYVRKTSDLYNNKFHITYNLTNYEFCNVNSTNNSCLSQGVYGNSTNEISKTENSIIENRIGKYLEYEFNFYTNSKKNFKVLTDNDLGITETGDFIYTLLSNIQIDGVLKPLDSKNIKLTKDQAIIRFPRFKKNLIMSTSINTYYSNVNTREQKNTYNIITLPTNSSKEIKIDPQGGKASITKSIDLGNNITDWRFLQISLLSLREMDKDKKSLNTFNNIDHFISNFTNSLFNTQEFSKDIYEKINVQKSRFYLKGKPNEDSIIYGDLIYFEENGRIILDGSRITDVNPGNVNLHFEILNWPFCRYNSFASQQNCPDESPDKPPKEGSLLELQIEFLADIAPYKLPYSEDRFSTQDFSFIFTGYVVVDDQTLKINKDSSNIELKGNSTIFTLQLPVFSKRASVQVFIDMTIPEGPFFLIIYLIGMLALLSASLIIFMCINKMMKKQNIQNPLLKR